MRLIKVAWLFLLIFLFSLIVSYDTDFGWHLRVGEFIAKNHAIPRQDLFSFTMPNYQYVYHSWLSELVIFEVFDIGRLWGVGIMYAFILTSAIFFIFLSSRYLTKGKINDLVFFLATGIGVFLVAGRTRVFALLFFAILYYIFLRLFYKNSKIIWVLPILFLAWANFHGSFILGIGSFIVFVFAGYFFGFSKIIKKNRADLLLIFLLSCAATLINPYFLKAWIYTFKIAGLSSVTLSHLNPDWLPLFGTSSQALTIFGMCLAVFSLYLLFLNKKIEKFQIFLFLFYFFLSIILSRFLVALVVILIPILNKVVADFIDGSDKKNLDNLPLKIIYMLIYVVVFLFGITNVLISAKTYRSLENYLNYVSQFSSGLLPDYDSINYTVKNLGGKRIFNEANSASAFLLLDPQFKLFYWGPMDNYWLDGKSFVLEYQDILSANANWEEKLKDYKIEAVFIKHKYPLASILKLKPEWKIKFKNENFIIFENTN